jgi:hypothetical protein
MNLKKLERYLRVNLLGPGPSSYKKIIYRAAVSQRLGNTEIGDLMEDGDCCWDYLKSCIKMSYDMIRRSECVKETAYII